MRELVGDIWKAGQKDDWRVITVNGVTDSHGRAVMGRGVALEAAKRFPELPAQLGRLLEQDDVLPVVTPFPDFWLLTMQVKHHWRDRASVDLIQSGLETLPIVADKIGARTIYMVRPGCGTGWLSWERTVRPMCHRYLDDRFVVVERG